MKKLLFIPLDYHLRPHEAWYEAFVRKFHTLHYSNLKEALEFMPDFVFVHSGSVPPPALAAIKEKSNCFIMQWTGDCRAELLEPVMNYKDVSDITLLACGIGQREMYEKALGHRVYYLQHGLAPDQFRPVIKTADQWVSTAARKIVFIGNNHGGFPGAVERTELCKILSHEFPHIFEVVGSGFASPEFSNTRTCKYSETPDIYNNAFIGISANSFNDYEGYWSNRQIDIMAAGTLCLMRHTPHAEQYFTNNENVSIYRNNEEVPQKIRYFLERPGLRDYIAKKGQINAQKLHTYDSRVWEIITYLQGMNFII